MDTQEQIDKIKELEDRIRKLETARITQDKFIPNSIGARFIGEGVRFVRYGLAANRPTSGEIPGAIWFSTDTQVLSIWAGSAWYSETLT